MVVVYYERVNGTWAKRKVCRNSKEDFWGFLEELVELIPVTAPCLLSLVITGSTWTSKEAFGLVWKACIWLRLLPQSNKFSWRKASLAGLDIVSLLLFQLGVMISLNFIRRINKIWFKILISSRFPHVYNMQITVNTRLSKGCIYKRLWEKCTILCKHLFAASISSHNNGNCVKSSTLMLKKTMKITIQFTSQNYKFRAGPKATH